MHDPLESNLNTSKSSSLQSYAMLLYRRAVHPEFFGIEAPEDPALELVLAGLDLPGRPLRAVPVRQRHLLRGRGG
jgi:hypothetical protein